MLILVLLGMVTVLTLIVIFYYLVISFSEGNHVHLYGLKKEHYALNMHKHCFIHEKEEIEQKALHLMKANNFTFFSWNIYKQKKKTWHEVFEPALNDSDIVLLQEAKENPLLTEFIEQKGFYAIHVVAFKKGQYANGVMNLARTKPQAFFVQKRSEPWIRFPKSGLITIYALDNQQDLMVANFHAINFSVGLKEFTYQVNTLFDILVAHEGPLILAGDFNTWRDARYNLLVKKIREINLIEVTYQNDVRTRILGKVIDYVFTRGIKIKEARVLDVQASDHKPIKITMQVQNF